jgi:hypothetical protein
MRIVGRLVAVLWFGLFVAMAGAAVAALDRKRKIVPVAAPDADEVRLAAIFEPIAFESTATAFRGGQVDLWFGGGILDLRNATLDPAGARLEVRAVFGGCQLVVPETWHVTTQVSGIGGAGDGRPEIDRSIDAPHLTIEGVVFLGGLGVTSDVPEEAERSIKQAIAKRRAGRSPDAPVDERRPEPISS